MNEEKMHAYAVQAMDWFIRSAPAFIGAVLFLIIGWWLIGKLENILTAAMKRKHFESSLQSFLRTTFSIGTKVILIIMVAGQIGFQTTSLAAIIGAAGLAIGLALQGSLANLAGGVLILIFKPFKVGDIITSSGFTGRVMEIQIFNTILLLPDNKIAILANGAVSNAAIVNNHKHDFLKLDLFVSVPADRDLVQIKASLRDFLGRDERVRKAPPLEIEIQEVAGGKLKLIISLCCEADVLTAVQYKANEHLLLFYQQNKIEF
ncbi:MAG TPA: mechanosensitive ion channel domain-containing protein [Bacteroidia bacterium]|jgi:small conductance mechanosensitive channel|nr:mechanosensitive ion channel domain-containing protein [Bacteroidia bacterium]